jgi:hypothetical protein
MTDKDIKENSSSSDIWLRGGFILVFALIYGISKIVIWSLVLFQFVSLLITKETNPQLRRFSKSLSVFVYQLLQYVMFNSDEKPFPFSDWPEAEEKITVDNPVSRKKTAKKTTRKKKVAAKKKE